EAGRQLYLRIRAGLRSFGGYPLAHDFAQVLAVEPFPKAVEILHQGAILSLSGSRTLSVLARGVPALQFEVSRLLPGSIPVLVALTSGPFQRPRARSYGFGSDNVAEVIRELRTLPPEEGGRAQYASLDLTPLLAKGKTPQGLFWLRVTGYDPEKKKLEGSPSDDRVLLVTDLGLFVKEAQDGSHEAFVMSLRSGEPVAAARVEMLGKNGIPVFSRETDAAGRASFPSFQGLEREHTPTVWVVQREGDLAFLPVGRDDRLLNLASFDTGGEHTRADEESLQGYLFSDRGIYRPGEEIHVAAIAKRVDWQPLPAGLPLELVVLDPRGLEVRRERVAFSPEGFEEMRLALDPSSPTGRYQIGLRLVKENAREVSLADTSVRVEEFQPDQLAIDAGFSAPPARGWLAPGDLRARVSLRNLFGTAAAGNRVRGSITLSPWYPSFAGYAGWHFFDPAAAKKSYSESLGDATTDEHGAAEFPLALERFERATYQLRFLAEGFQKENGRSVARDATAVVSPLPQLIAWKADGELGFIRAGSKRQVELVAVGPSLERVAAPQLALELVEISNVAVLTRQENGTYAYQSVRKETSRGSEPLPLPVQGLARALPTATPGSFAWIVRDASGTELNRIPFEVTGAGARGRNVERDAELRIKLDRADYAPGDEIELEVRAPYTGAGLVTIERDRVYAASWFRASTEISLQHIRVPAGLEGNAYVVVSFARALDSDEIFVSPLSSGAAPFTLRRERRVHALKLDVPERVEPGTRLRIGYDNPAPARLAVFAVDEGILQVARYSSPDPLAYLLRKRALEVKTAQILDLVFPEFKLAQALSAPGGDLDQHLAGNLNPFKRKGLPPVAYWSGIFAAPAGKGELSYDLPDHFSGTVRVLAVAVSADSVGTAERRTTVRGPFVIRPNAPYFAAPGDEFWVSALVANDLEGADANQPVRVSLAPSGGLELLGPGEVALAVAPGQDAPVRFRVRARPQLGAASLVFAAQAGERRAHTTLELSVRPGVAKRTSLASGVARGGGATELPRPRALFADGRESRVLVSGAPLALARGLVAYLDEYPHPCTEQLVSAAFPDLVLGGRRGFERDPEGVRARHARVLRALQARQDADGAFALWLPGGPVSDFVTVYATHFLIESRDRGFEVPGAVLSRALAHLEQLVHVPGRSLPELRNQAYALYLLARAGHVPARELAALRAELDERAKEAWPKDLAAGWVAATDALLHLDGDASAALRSLSLDVELARDPTGFVDSLAARGALLDLFARHFPGRARALPAEALLETARQLGGERFNTLSSSFVVLGLESLARLEAQAAAARAKLVWTGADGKPHELALEGDEIRSASVPEGAVRLELSPGGSEPVFWQLVETGYDLAPAEAPSTARIDVAREVDGADGKPVSEAHLGDSLEVHVRVRADADAVDVAVVDLLPAGFEVDLGSGELQARRSLPVARPTWTPDYVDVREDRVVLYGTA
ncbi:MAG TPA: alpha-2-macroglobulin, partial [Myxococcota bacterium]|nr:alpha-2-macroglobulin [Myxococcota bacterium]